MLRRIADYAPRLRPAQFFCEVTALTMWTGLVPDSRRASLALHIAANDPALPPRARGTRAHYYSRMDVFRVAGVPVCSPVQAWLQSCIALSATELVVLGDSLMRRKNPLTTPERLAAAVVAHGSKPGARVAREALLLIRPRTDSPRETELRLLIADGGLPEPAVNPAINDLDGRFLGYGDLTYLEYRTIIEYDGEHHFGLDAQRAHDLDRVESFRRAQWRVIQIHKRHLAAHGAPALALIREGLLAAGWRP